MANICTVIEDIIKSDPLTIDITSKNDFIFETKTIRIEDNRLALLKKYVDKHKDRLILNDFYKVLIEIIARSLRTLQSNDVNRLTGYAYTKKDDIVELQYAQLTTTDIIQIFQANQKFAKSLFEYVCKLLKEEKDITLSYHTLSLLFNRNPKLLSFAVEESYIYSTFNFQKLASILNKNKTLEKSNISLDDKYDLLISSVQIDNPEVFKLLISKEEFNSNHEKINEFLYECNARTFVNITRIIRENYDKKFDAISIIKKRVIENNEDKFAERVIIETLERYFFASDLDFVTKLISDPSLKIDYNFNWADYIGNTTLKDLLAFKGDKNITIELLKNKNNISHFYYHGESSLALFNLYARTGDYNTALECFNSFYNIANDYEEYNANFENNQPAYAGMLYTDSLISFISTMCSSFEREKVSYEDRKKWIYTILEQENVKYILLEELLDAVVDTLECDDYYELIDYLLKRKQEGTIEFLTQTERQNLYYCRVIKVASKEEVDEIRGASGNEGTSRVRK